LDWLIELSAEFIVSQPIKPIKQIRQIKHFERRFFVARITVEDCLRKVSNRFLLVNMVSKRVRQIREGSDYLVSSPKNEDIVVALREVAAGKIQMVPSEPEKQIEE
jgi:DNA-directed RNA polymerase subunit omega